MRVAPPILLTDEQRHQLSAAANSRSVSVRFAQRARMILLAAEGWQDKRITADYLPWRHLYQRESPCKDPSARGHLLLRSPSIGKSHIGIPDYRVVRRLIIQLRCCPAPVEPTTGYSIGFVFLEHCSQRCEDFVVLNTAGAGSCFARGDSHRLAVVLAIIKRANSR